MPQWSGAVMVAGYRWLPLGLGYALRSWRVLKQAGRTALMLGALRNVPISFVPLPRLDVVGSSPIAPSLEVVDFRVFERCLVANGDQALFRGHRCGHC